MNETIKQKKEYDKFVKELLCPNQCGHLRFKIKEFIEQSNLNLLNEIQVMIADEIRTAQKENQQTSRLTSLSVRIDEKFNI